MLTKSRIIIVVLFLLGLIYLIWPGPNEVSDFPPLPESVKSDEPGDTVQVENISAYFSQADRATITQFYKNWYKNANFGFLPPIKLNHPPEEAWQFVRDQQTSTFLEEYVYPLRGSIFVNGYEPLVENEIANRPSNFFGNMIHINGQYYASKATLRYHPVPVFWRLIVYIGIWASILGLYKLTKKIWRERKDL
jgi:hypothetical protein